MQRRGGTSTRPGPRTRQAEERLSEERCRSEWREKQQRYCERQRQRRQQALDMQNETAEDDMDGGTSRATLQRRAAELSRDLIFHLERLADSDLRAAVLDTVFKNQAVRMLLPDYYPSLEDARAQRNILQNIRLDLEAMKVPHCSGKLARKRAILEAVVSELDCDSRRFHRILGTWKQNVDAAMRRLEEAHTKTSFRFKVPCRKKRDGGIPDEIQAAVIRWWTKETRVSPNRKQVRKKRLGRLVYDRHAAHLLMESQAQLYERFKAAHPLCPIMQHSFINLRPFFVIRCEERNVCCCRHHIQLLFLLEALNAFRDPKNGAHTLFRCTCHCFICGSSTEGVCRVGASRFSGVTSMWMSVLCEKAADAEFHNLSCLTGNCMHCGVHTFQLCPLERVDGPHRMILWKKFEYETVEATDSSKPQKRIKEVTLTTSFSVFMDFMKPALQEFVFHNFCARWQADQAKLAKECLPRGAILTHIDFDENYTFQVQNEIQSLYYHSTQVTIMVQVVYRVDIVDDENDGAPVLIRETHYWISDDKAHDTLFVQHCLLRHWRWLLSRGSMPSTHIVFSDGCSAQFKGARSLYFVARYPSLTGGCKMLWNFFDSGHGKGEWDGARAVVKRALRTEQLLHPNRALANACDCVTFLDATLAGPVPLRNGRIRSYRFFHLVDVNEVDRSQAHACHKIPGSSKLHSVFACDARDPTKVMVRALSCFYGPCLEEDFNNCDQKSHVAAWKVCKIQPLNVQYAQTVLDAEDDEDDASWEYEHDEDSMFELVQPGDNFAIPAEADNVEGVSFYILQCQSGKHCVIDDFECPWGAKFKRGDFVITATYYQKWGRKDSHNYVYLKDSRPAHVDADIVLACKFQMIPRAHKVKGGDPVYSLPPESVDIITCMLNEYQDCH